MTDLPELVVHIGAGKTGSTSIQMTLTKNAVELANADTVYLGCWLENVRGVSQYPWFSLENPQIFFSARPEELVEDQIVDLLYEELTRQGARGVRTAVWSNEAFLVQKVRTLRVLRRLAQKGVRIRPVLYVRRHDKRAISAYMEFEIRSKRHAGDLHDYNTWLDGAADRLYYARHAERWMTPAWPLAVFNYDDIDDVAQHFCQVVLGIEGLNTKWANEASPPALLTAWTVFSGSRPTKTWAREFYRLIVPLLIRNNYSKNVVPKPEELMPNEADLEDTQARFSEDLTEINAVLAEQGQPPMIFDKVTPPDVEATDWELQQMLFRMVFSLQEQVLDLKNEVATLRGTQGTNLR